MILAELLGKNAQLGLATLLVGLFFSCAVYGMMTFVAPPAAALFGLQLNALCDVVAALIAAKRRGV